MVANLRDDGESPPHLSPARLAIQSGTPQRKRHGPTLTHGSLTLAPWLANDRDMAAYTAAGEKPTLN